MSSQLDQFQDEIFFRLKSDPVCRAVAILKQQQGNIEQDVYQALGALNAGEDDKRGACLLVMRSRMVVENTNAAGVTFDLVGTVRVLEMPSINRDANGTGLTASVLAERVLRVLGQYLPKGAGGVVLPDKRAVEPYDDDLASGIIGWDVTPRQRGGLPTGDKVATPAIAGTSAAVTVSCATPGSTIYITLDGSCPCSGNELAAVYAGAFAVSSGDLVRAGAETPDKVPSDTAARTF